jgi:hypothetical protein
MPSSNLRIPRILFTSFWGGVSGGMLASVISSIEDVPKALNDEARKDFSYHECEGDPPHNQITQLIH